MRRILSLLIVLTASLIAGDSADMVKEAENRWVAALTKNDFPNLEKVLADDLIYTHSNGASDTKREFIDNLKKKVRIYESLSYGSMTVKVVGNTAILSAKGKMRVITNGTPADIKMVVLHAFVKGKGGWQLLGHQSARLQ